MELLYSEGKLSGDARKLLFVDDDTAIASITKTFLEKRGFVVTVARSGEEAQAILHDNFFPLVVLDWMMPGMTGPEICEWIRQRPGGDIPTILMQTAKTDIESQEEAMDKGVDDYLVKPYSLKLLALRLRVLEERARDRIGKTLADEQVKGLNKQWQELMQTIPDIVYCLDENGMFTFLNQAVIGLGYSAEELTGKHFSFILSPDDVARVSRELVLPSLMGQKTGDDGSPNLFDEKRAGLRGTVGLEVAIRAKNGKGLDVEVSKQVEISSSGLWDTSTEGPEAKFLGTVGIIRDVSERHRREEDLRIAYRCRSQFLANVSHELRTPLNTIVPVATLLAENREQNLSKEDVKQVNMICRAGDQLLKLINDVLEISEAEATFDDLTKVEFERAQFDAMIIDGYKPKFEEKGLKFDYRCSGEVPQKFYTDFYRLIRVVDILLDNALKFTEHGGVEVELKPCGDLLRLAVRDTGCGISAKNIDKICEPFFQGDDGNDRRRGGTGIGLAVARKLITLLGGEFDVQSEEGLGTSVIFSFDGVSQSQLEVDDDVGPKASPEPKKSSKNGKEDPIAHPFSDKRIVLCHHEVRVVYKITSELEKMGLSVIILREPWQVADYFEEGKRADAALIDAQYFSSQDILKRFAETIDKKLLFLLNADRQVHPSLLEIATDVFDPVADIEGLGVSLHWYLGKEE